MPSTVVSTPDGANVDYPARLVTVSQIEERHPALKGRVRRFILRADLGSPDYQCLRDSIIRLGRWVYIDEPKFLDGLRTHAGKPAATPRNPHGRGAARKRAA